MNDKTKSKVDTRIETEELKDDELGEEELENVDGGAVLVKEDSILKDGHDKWIDVLSVDWGTHKPGS